ncbi:MAG: tail assembly chaperone, partial [Burkholderia gladioli]
FKAWSAYQMALVAAMNSTDASATITWPKTPAPYVAPVVEVAPQDVTPPEAPTKSA